MAISTLLSACAHPREEDPTTRIIRHCREMGYPKGSEDLRRCVAEQQVLRSIEGGIKQLLTPSR
jgi:hypothetical protein